MFNNFIGYVRFFLLDDLLDEKQKIKFFLPFDNFKSKPGFLNVNDYLIYKKRVIDFIDARNKRIEKYIKNKTDIKLY